MSETLATDVLHIAELFRRGGWTELRVEGEGISLLLSTDRAAAGLDGDAPTVAAPARAAPVPAAVLAAAAAPMEAGDPAWLPVAAPNLGTFYRSPKPGASPFVELGDRVEPDTEICLLEVMKLFTSVKAGVAGIARRVCAGDGELVEAGRVLFLIDPV
jgi:biotin carboxyl carrier protein